MKKRITAFLMCLCMAIMLLPMSALAAGSDFVVSGGTSGTDYTYAADGTLTFINSGDYTVSMTTPGATTTSDKIVVNGGTDLNPVYITLSGVSIDQSSAGACAFKLQGSSVVSLTLSGTNTLESTVQFAGLQVPAGTKLTINGTGSLSATSSGSGAGIGSGAGTGSGAGDGGMVAISGGTVTATSNGGGAGIGGGFDSDGGTVAISGGTVTATSNGGGAGIGGGFDSDGGTVAISGGTVTATSSDGGAGIGGGEGGGAGSVAISGGTVTAMAVQGTADINGDGIGGGGQYNSAYGGKGSGGECVITGGSVCVSTMGPTVYRDDAKTVPVYLTTVTLDGVTAETPVSSLSVISGTSVYAYGITDMRTDASGKLYLWLPASALTEKAVALGTCYKGAVTTTTDTLTSLGPLSAVWNGSTKDIGWYVNDTAASAYTVSDGYELAGLAALVNAGASGTVYYDAGGMVTDQASSSGSVSGTDFSGKTITLSMDIDLGGGLTTPSNWTPIGVGANGFAGTFDGAGHQIQNTYINYPDGSALSQNFGLFGLLVKPAGSEAGTVQNLVLTEYCILGQNCSHAGGIVGTVYDGTIQNCGASGTINTNAAYTGGIAGYLNQGSIKNCWAEGSIESTHYAGGIAGCAGLTAYAVENCCSTVTFGGVYTEGFGAAVGRNIGSCTVTNCYYLDTSAYTDVLKWLSEGAASKTAAELATAETAWILNTTNGTETNSGVWAQGTTPVFADGTHAAVYRILLTNSSDPAAVYSAADGSVTLPTDPVGTNGKTFLGWYSDAAFTSVYQVPQKLTSDITVYGDFGTRVISLADYTTKYTGSAVSYAGTVTDNASGVNGASALTYTYYTDQGVTETADGGAAPTAAGTYYVQATAAEDTVNKIDAASSNFAKMTVTRQSSSGGSTSVYYDITAVQSAGGTITLSSARIRSGGSVTVTVTPDDGYQITDVTVSGVSVGAVTDYTISNITKNETVAAVFEQTEWENPYSDVASGAWYYVAVGYVSQKGLMNGDGSHFSPEGSVTRAMFVTVLYRLSGDDGSYTNSFSDVPSGQWYETAAAWAYANGITSGMGDNHFSPENSISREQLAVMLYNYAKYKGYDVSVGEDENILSYNDALSISDYAYSALQWACGAGILNGDDNGNLSPQGSATRAEVATMLQRFIEKVIG